MNPTFLQEKNNHERDNHIVFDEGPHIYTIDGDSNYMSVTTWNHSHFSKFDAEKVINNMKNGKNWNESNKYWGMTNDEIKELWSKNGQEQSQKGTDLHYDIECYYNNMDISNNTVEWTYFLKFLKNHKHLTPYRTEWMVWDKELKVAGSIDMVFENEDGRLSIYDWKRAKEIKRSAWSYSKTECIDHIPDSNFWHYSLQLNTYKYLLEKNYGKEIKDMYLVRLHPNNKNSTYEKIEVPNLQSEIKELMELRKNNLLNELRS